MADDIQQGRLLEVSTLPAGGITTADHLIGDMVLQLDDTSDFSENGGSLMIEGVEYVYNTKSDDDGTVTLATSLALDYPMGSEVLLHPLSEELWAMVQVEDEGDVTMVRVPHDKVDLVSEGVRSELEQESVLVVMDGTEWVLYDVIGRRPSIDGAYIREGTIPAAEPAPPTRPTLSPASDTRGGVKVLHVRYTAVDNASPVTYDIHISTNPIPDVPTAATLAGSTGSTSFTIRAMPDGTDLLYDTIYYTRVHAHSEGLYAATAGVEDSDALFKVDNEMVSANYAYLGNVLADQITSGFMSADVTVSGSFSTAESGQRVVMDSTGLNLMRSDGSPLIEMPTDPNKPSVWRGDAEINRLTVNELTTLVTSELAQNATFTLQSGIMPPGTPPSATIEWDTKAYTNDGHWDDRHGWSSDQDNMDEWQFTFNNATKRLETWAANTGQKVAESAALPGSTLWGTCVFGGGVVYVLTEHSAQGEVFWQLRRYSPIWMTTDKTWPWNQSQGTRRPAIAYDDGNTNPIMIIQSTSSQADKLYINRYRIDASDNLFWQYSNVSDITYNAGLAGAWVGTGDFGAKRLLIGNKNNTAQWTALAVPDASATFTAVSGDDFEFAGAANKVGIYYNNNQAKFFSMDQNGKRHRYEGMSHKWFGGMTEQWQAAYTWRKNATPTAQTTRSPLLTFNMVKRARVRITTAAIPPGGPDAAWVYLRKYSTSTALGNMYYQGSVEGSPPNIQIVLAVFSGTLDPTSNSFGTATPARLKSASLRSDGAAKFQVDGAGAGRFDGLIPPGAWMGWPAATAPAGWYLCQGQALNTATDPDLFAVLGYTYGGSGTTFNLPDFSNRLIMGVGSTTALGANEGYGEGARYTTHDHTHDHTTPSHTHSITPNVTNYNQNTTTGGTASRVVGVGGAGSADHSHGGATGGAAPTTNDGVGIRATATNPAARHAFLGQHIIMKR